MKDQRNWNEADDQYLIQNAQQVTARQMAEKLGRSIYAVESRLRIFRERGLIPAAELAKPWTLEEDRVLVANYARLTPSMLATDLGRSLTAVNSRLRRLRDKGWRVDAMPRGKAPMTRTQKARAKNTSPELALEAERLVMRDEVAAYLSAQIARNALALEQAKAIAQNITERVLKAPDYQFRQAAQKPVAVIVQEAA